MKHQMILRLPILAVICALASTAQANQSGDENNDPSPSAAGHELISTPTYAQSMEDAIRELMEDFSHMTSLHESFVRHPLFSHPRFGSGDAAKSAASGKPFSTWGSFGSLSRWSPRYEVIDDVKDFRVKMDVPGFHFHEMTVELESGGRVLSISGTKEKSVHESTEDGEDEKEKKKTAAMGEKWSKDDDGDDYMRKFEYHSHSSTSFQQKFTLDPSIDTSHMTANLVNGVLEVRAPRKTGAWNNKHIPITQFDEEVWKELMATDETGEIGETPLMKE
mmetsp:Transcript_12536/g.26699  ORF Transcript_12536/g.26699 Transcript_12536/m.26699 type:complete len:277 (-) Transcript_12536:83-913(-)